MCARACVCVRVSVYGGRGGEGEGREFRLKKDLLSRVIRVATMSSISL